MASKAVNKAKLNEMTLYDHDLVLRVMDGNIPLAQRWINSYFGEGVLKVKSVRAEVMMFNLQAEGRDGKLDILAEDQDGCLINIEIQNIVSDFPPQRSRGYSALMDIRILKEKGMKWEEVSDSYVIVQFAEDPFGEGAPFYVFERKDQNGKPLHDGAHIMYVNGAYADLNTDLGKLNHDLKCANADEMIYNEFRENVRAYKEGEKKDMLGRVVEEMCEESRNEGKLEGAITAFRSLGMHGSQLIDAVVKSCDTTEKDVKQYLASMK